ncbi:hypothetical protein EYC59_02660 [Candidatus Saccharibacteria bacterium]|nr:MAG: hypothetical protein EYC59_02660 [Candidatus Saccharibacteria bacterium]
MITREGRFIKLDADERARIKFDEALRNVAGTTLYEAGGLDIEVTRTTSELGVGIFLRTLAQRALVRELRVRHYQDSSDPRLRMQIPDLQQTAYDQIEVGQRVLCQLTDEERGVFVLPTIQDYLADGTLPQPSSGVAVTNGDILPPVPQKTYAVYVDSGWRYGGAA